MRYMLDTDMCIYLIKKHPENVLKKFKLFNIGDICISSVTFSELLYGVEKSQHHQKNRVALEEFVLPLDIISYDEKSAHYYSHIRSYLEKKGLIIDSLDLMIAANAQSINATLVTNNIREFSRVPKLKIENWI